MKIRLVLVITAVILSIFATSCFSNSKTTTAAISNSVNLQQMANDIATLKSNFTILNTSFTAIQAQVGSSGGVSKSEFDALANSFNALKSKVDNLVIPTIPPITGYAKQTDLESANAKIAADAALIASLNTQLIALNTALTALTARVNALEHPPTTTITPPPITTTTAQAVRITLAPFAGATNLSIVAPATTEQNLTYSLSIQNPNSITQNVAFTLYFVAVPNFPAVSDPNYYSTGYPRLTTLTGGTLYFTLVQTTPSIVAFSSGVTIAPNTTNNYIVNFAVKFQGAGLGANIAIYTQVTMP